MTEPLLHAVAQALADGRRVLILGDSFELVDLLAAAPVKELVVVTALADPDAPVGSTATGAPVRLRLDWAERPHSKDLIVDPAGDAPADEVARVLKKAGIYLTHNPDAPALARLPAQARIGRGAGVILAGTIPPPPVDVPESAPPAEAPPEVLDHPDPLEAPEPAVEPHAERIAALEAQVQAHAQALEAAEALAQRAIELEDALAAADQAASRQREASDAALAALRSELAEQAAEYDRVRSELAERRIADRRIDAVQARFEAARLEMVKEIEVLRAQVRDLGEPAEDAATLVGERDEARRAHDEVAEVVEAGLRELGANLPAAPPAYAGDGPRSAWLHAVRHALGVAAAEIVRLRHRRTELEGQIEGLWIALRERDEALLAADEPPEPTPPHPASTDLDEAALLGQVEALEAALAAERRAREAESRAWRGKVEAAERVLANRAHLVEELARTRAEVARSRLRVAAGEEQQRRLAAERLLRDERITDLEVMLATHTRMQTLLTEALAETEAARDEAESDRRVLDANVRLLQRELDALRP